MSTSSNSNCHSATRRTFSLQMLFVAKELTKAISCRRKVSTASASRLETSSQPSQSPLLSPFSFVFLPIYCATVHHPHFSHHRGKENIADISEEITQLDKELFEAELAAYDQAVEALILVLCQERGAIAAKRREAHGLLTKKKFTWKLSNDVLQYPMQGTQTASSSASAEDARTFVRVFDNALIMERKEVVPNEEGDQESLSNKAWTDPVSCLREIFRPSSPFWSEHSYDITSNCSRSAGYFSYLYPLKTRPACCAVEQVIDLVYKLACHAFPTVKTCAVAEWWVHTRPHCRGHQLHFDSDETRIGQGRSPAHPLASCVVFLGDESVGGEPLPSVFRFHDNERCERAHSCDGSASLGPLGEEGLALSRQKRTRRCVRCVFLAWGGAGPWTLCFFSISPYFIFIFIFLLLVVAGLHGSTIDIHGGVLERDRSHRPRPGHTRPRHTAITLPYRIRT